MPRGKEFERLEPDPTEKPTPEKLDWEVKAPRFYKRAFEEIARKLRLEGKMDDQKIRVLHSMKNVAIAKAFPEAEVEFLEKTYGKAGKLEHHGFESKKGDVETHLGEHAKMVVLLDEDVDITWQIMRQIQPGGIFICLPEAATHALETGNFYFKGVMTMNGADPDFVKDPRRFGSVGSDDELERAGNSDAFVSYQEAREIVQKVYPNATTGIVEKYQELLEKAIGGDNEEKAGLKYVLEKEGGAKEDIILKPLPPQPGSEGNWWVLKKRLN